MNRRPLGYCNKIGRLLNNMNINILLKNKNKIILLLGLIIFCILLYLSIIWKKNYYRDPNSIEEKSKKVYLEELDALKGDYEDGISKTTEYGLKGGLLLFCEEDQEVLISVLEKMDYQKYNRWHESVKDIHMKEYRESIIYLGNERISIVDYSGYSGGGYLIKLKSSLEDKRISYMIAPKDMQPLIDLSYDFEIISYEELFEFYKKHYN